MNDSKLSLHFCSVMVKNGNYFQRKCSVKTEEALAKKELHEAFGKQGFSELGTVLLETI